MSTPAARMPLVSSLSRATPGKLALVLAFAVIYLVWGSTFLAIRVAVETLPPLSMAAVRFLVAGTVLLLGAGFSGPRPTARQWLNAALVGGLFFLGNHGLLSVSARFIPSSVACIIIATEVPIIAVLSSLLLRDQPLTRRSILGAVLGIGGVAWLLVGQRQGPDALPLWPCLAVFAGSLCWATGVVMSQRLAFPPNPVRRAGMQMVCGGALLAIASLIRGEDLAFASFTARSVGSFAYLIVFGSVLAFACYTWLLKQVRADAVATHVFVNPIVAVAVGAWLGGERLAPAHFVSVGLILASVLVILGGARRDASNPDT